jgi:hypothetical protein
MNRLFPGIILILCSTHIYAADTAGVYKSAIDFKNNKLDYKVDCLKGKFRIHFVDFYGASPIVVIRESGAKYKLKGSEVYGFRNCEGKIFRYYRHGTYQLAEAGNVYIYTRERNVAQSKGFITTVDYFFSTSADGEIMPLHKAALEKAYSYNEGFLARLQYFRGSVTDYDEVHHMFCINYLFTSSLP